MSLTNLQVALQTQADNNKNVVTITAAVIQGAALTPRANFDSILNAALGLQSGLAVTISQKIPAPVDNTLTFSGQASFLGLTGISAVLTLVQQTDDAETVDLRLLVSLGDSWQFSQSFPQAQGYPFDALTLNKADYAFTSAPTDTLTWNSQSITLQQGLNFVSALSLETAGPFGLLMNILESFSGTDTITFTGTIDPASPSAQVSGVPAMLLTGFIDNQVEAIPSYFPLSNPGVMLETTLGDDGTDRYWLSFLASLNLNATAYDIKALLQPGMPILNFWFSSNPPLTANSIINQLLGGSTGAEDFTTNIPSELSKIFNEVSLRALVISVNIQTLDVAWISVIIGSTGSWEMSEEFTIDDIALKYTLSDPFGSKNSSFWFEATSSHIFPDVFKGEFDVQISYDLSSQALGIAASFTGEVKLSDLVSKLSKDAVNISGLGFDITFEDFGMTFTKATTDYTYSLYGSAQESLQLPMLGANMTADFSVYINSGSDPTQSSYKISGGFAIGESYLEAEVDLSQSAKMLTADWDARGGGTLGVADIIKEFGFTAPDIPEELDLGLKAVNLTYDISNAILILEADSTNYGKAVFVGRKAPVQQGVAALPDNTAGVAVVNEAVDTVSNGATSDDSTPADQGSSWQFFCGLAVNQTIDLTNLPLINKVLNSADTVEIQNIQVVIASNALDETAATDINNLLASGYPTVPAKGLPAGVALSMLFTAGSFQAPLSLSTGGNNNQVNNTEESNSEDANTTTLAVAPNNSAMAPTAPASDGTVWYNLQKTFGPVSFQKVGIRYKDSVLYVLMNASLSAGGLTIAVIGLGVGSPLKTFDPHFNIDGLALTFTEGPVEISGALVGTIDPINFYGELILGFPEFTITALGAYAQVADQPSFFLYAVLDYPIGGPSFFFVTGLAAGFGFNRKLLIPDISGVATFPLVQWAMNTGNPPTTNPGGDIGAQVTQVLTTLATSGVVTPSIGAYWLALGIRFTSFDLIDSFVLLTVTFGTQFEIDLLGLSRMTLPPAPAPAVALVELELKASFSPNTGLIAIQGQLTPQSYVLSPNCHLTGGFAFYSWFGGPHEGEFVVTLGGYGPRFMPPSYYPQVPRLELNWQVSSNLSVKGDLYFALTSNAVMAGGGLSATWQSGGIRAWFDVEADFLMVFVPFHYYLSASVHLGASFRINLLFTHTTITIHLGVGLEIWGPDFTGQATVDLSIISFTINFGSSNQSTQTTISWPDFVAQLMPKAQNSDLPNATMNDATSASIIQITVASGLLKTLSPNSGDLNYIVSGEQFQMITQSAIPVKTQSFSSNIILLAPEAGQPTPNIDFGVGPTGTDNSFNSQYSITINSLPITTTETSQEFYALPVLRNVSKALWEKKDFDDHGVPQNVDPVNDTTIQNVLVGYKILPYAPPPDCTPLPIPISNLQYTIDPNLQQFAWSAPYYPTTDSFSTQPVSSTINGTTAQSNRSQLVTAMLSVGLTVSSTIDVNELANQSTDYLLAAPALSLLGEQKQMEVA